MNLLDLARSALPPEAATAVSVARSWSVTTPGGRLVEVIFADALNADEVRALYPGTAVRPVVSGRRPATAAESATVRGLLTRVAKGWPKEDRDEALRMALGDPVSAVVSLQALAAELVVPDRGPYTTRPLAQRDPADDRRTCRDCASLVDARCVSARRGNGPVGAAREYQPIADLLRRCAHFVPPLDDGDQRPGRERWPDIEEAKS